MMMELRRPRRAAKFKQKQKWVRKKMRGTARLIEKKGGSIPGRSGRMTPHGPAKVLPPNHCHYLSTPRGWRHCSAALMMRLRPRSWQRARHVNSVSSVRPKKKGEK